MRLVEPDLNTPVNYFTFFQASPDEKADVLSYLQFLVSESAYERVATDAQYAPSTAWCWWAAGTFVGISNDLLMIKSGHRFVRSQEAMAYLPGVGKPSLIQYLRKCVAKFRQVSVQGDLERNIRAFHDRYRSFKHPSEHGCFLETHGFTYLRMLEVYNLMKLSSAPRAVIEIGAGAAVMAALMRSVFDCKYAIVDLPETISVGYSYLKTMFPELRVALPNVVQHELSSGGGMGSLLSRYDVVFILPFQAKDLPNAWFDMGINVSSFQEMNIEVVNEYLSLLRRVLRPGGSLVLENLKTSRETAGNELDRYCLNGFHGETLSSPSYADFVVQHVPGLKHFFYQGRRE